MKKANTVPAVLASQNSSLDEVTVFNIATLPTKCKARRDGRRLARILKTISSRMDTFVRLYEAYELKYPFHRDELQKAFTEAV